MARNPYQHAGDEMSRQCLSLQNLSINVWNKVDWNVVENHLQRLRIFVASRDGNGEKMEFVQRVLNRIRNSVVHPRRFLEPQLAAIVGFFAQKRGHLVKPSMRRSKT